MTESGRQWPLEKHRNRYKISCRVDFPRGTEDSAPALRRSRRRTFCPPGFPHRILSSAFWLPPLVARKTVQTKFVSGSTARVDLAPLGKRHCRQFQERGLPKKDRHFSPQHGVTLNSVPLGTSADLTAARNLMMAMPQARMIKHAGTRGECSDAGNTRSRPTQEKRSSRRYQQHPVTCSIQDEVNRVPHRLEVILT
jgi:hypothetical protein